MEMPTGFPRMGQPSPENKICEIEIGRSPSSRVMKGYAPTVLQIYASAAHGLPQQCLHALQLNHHETEFLVLFSSEPFPSCRSGGSFAEPVEEGPDFRDGKPALREAPMMPK